MITGPHAILTFVRHGATQSTASRLLDGHSGTPLSEDGRNEIGCLAKHLEFTNPRQIFCSTALRSLQTASIISDCLKIGYRATAALNERDYGPFAGLPRLELIAKRKALSLSNVDPTNDWDGAVDVESDATIWLRVHALIDDARRATGHTLLVTHAGVIKAVLYRIFAIPAARRRCFYLRTGSAVTLRAIDGCLELTELWVPTISN